MYKKILKISAVALMGIMSLGGHATAEELSKAEVEKIVGEFLRANPEVVVQSLEAYQAKQREQQQVSSQEKVKKHGDFLNAKDAPSVGADSADVVVTEFFDYNCGYCRRAVPDIQEIVKEDSKVRFVFREMPILSENSADVAKWALAASKQDKYFEFHVALMDFKGNRDAKALKKLAKTVGLDADQLEKDANSDAIKKQLEESLSVAQDIGIQGTPAFIINGKLYPGYLGPEGLRAAIEGARQES